MNTLTLTAGILAAYSTLLLVIACLLFWEGAELYLHWCHKILVLLVNMLCLFLLCVLCIFWRDKWLTFGLSIQVFAPFVHLCCVIVMILFSWPVAFYLAQLEGEVRLRRYRMIFYDRRKIKRCNKVTKLKALQVAIGLAFIIILFFLYLLPLRIYSPCILEKENLGPKPAFFAHRGAPMVGPENTMMAFEKAVEQGAHGLETDVYLSVDHVPFLMHDHDLRRTTNIDEILPSSSLNNTAFFTWDFLSTLNAGKWFLDTWRRPYFQMRYLSEADKNKARNQTIPKLSNLLELAKKEKKLVIFDLHRPPPKHPLRSTYVRKVVSVILDSKIEQHLIYWLPGFDRNYVRDKAPGFQQVGRLYSIDHLKEEKIRIINVEYKELFHNGLRDYKAANITINLYTINEPWLYSLAWCSRIHSVTTNDIHLLSQLNHPHFFMTPRYYLFIWVLIDAVSAICTFSIFHFHWSKVSKREKMLKNVGIRTDIQHTGRQQSKSENQEAENLPLQHPTRIVESPWTQAALYPHKTNKIKKYPSSRHFVVTPEKRDSQKPVLAKKEIKLMVPTKDDVELVPARMPIKPTNAPIQGASLQTALSKVREPKIPTREDHHPGTYFQEIPMTESSYQTFKKQPPTMTKSPGKPLYSGYPTALLEQEKIHTPMLPPFHSSPQGGHPETINVPQGEHQTTSTLQRAYQTFSVPQGGRQTTSAYQRGLSNQRAPSGRLLDNTDSSSIETLEPTVRTKEAPYPNTQPQEESSTDSSSQGSFYTGYSSVSSKPFSPYRMFPKGN
ncbi:glycerophosphodiester phosphodiesterase domain-containing protein 4 isoform X2 [Tamandua tetradactyla]|uniref:glycerophosphodiester phosphodiesterase domain-containing protein 4 isoform X2 n=1 Tax=Tamandua tetradactyla TaxID=48850 RepID=UPI0040545C23